MHRKSVTIVDDEKNIGVSLRLILEVLGYEVRLCSTASEFRAGESLQRFDAYLLDVRLPDGHGIELLRELRKQENHAPVIMISVHSTIADAVEATHAVAFDFLEKPLSRNNLLLALKNAL